MKSFKNYITEARMTTHQEIVDAIAAHKKAGEILNPVYQDLGSQARRIFGKDCEHVRELILKHFGSGDKTEELNNLYYDWPYDSFASLGKAEKSLSKVKGSKYNDVVTAANEVIKKWKPVASDLKELKGKVVKVTQKRAEAKEVAAKEMSKKFADSSSLIKVLESHLKEYKDGAEKYAIKFVEDRLNFLKKHDWNLDKAVPRDRYGYDKSAEQKRNMLKSITKSKSAYLKHGEDDIREPNQEMIKRFIDMNVKAAEDSYKSFMQKMIQKIGKPVIDAKMTGNIWTNAILTVTTNDGEQQVWETKMIINFSKYQQMFNQFPSRRKK